MPEDHERFEQLWQDEYFHRIIRNDQEFVQKAEYIVGNPQTWWPKVKGYPWVWLGEA